MTATIELNSARRKLSQVLGEDATKDYMFHLKSWFRKRISKEEFDLEARKLLSASDQAHLHNEFLLAILNKCQTLANMSPNIAAAAAAAAQNTSKVPQAPFLTPKKSSSGGGITLAAAQNADDKYELQQQLLLRQAESAMGHSHSPSGGVLVMGSDRLRKGKVKRKGTKSGRPSFDQRFQPQQATAAGKPEDEGGPVRDEERALRFCHRDPPLLPDTGLIHGRMLVTAWEERLDEGVEDDAVELVVQAVEAQLRKLVMALVMRRKACRMRDGKFPHAAGAPRPNPWLFNTQKRRRRDAGEAEEVAEPVETNQPQQQELDPMLAPVARVTAADAEQVALYESACAVADGARAFQLGPISPFDLLAVLRERKAVLPCHTVYAVNMERVIARLHHRGHDE